MYPSRFEAITPQFFKLKILKLDDLYRYEIAKLVSICSWNAPGTFAQYYFTYEANVHSHSTRNQSSNSLTVPRFSTFDHKNL